MKITIDAIVVMISLIDGNFGLSGLYRNPLKL